MIDIVHELDECAKRNLAIAPDYIQRSLECLAAIAKHTKEQE